MSLSEGSTVNPTIIRGLRGASTAQMIASNRKFASFPHSCFLPVDTMDITVLLNATDDAEEDWEFEASDSEEEGAREAEYVYEGDVSDSEALDELQRVVRRTGNAYLGLFSLFFTREFRDSLHSWTNTMLNDKGKPEVTVYELDAYIGLEIAMSFNPVTEIKELWSQKPFMGQSDFVSTMAGNRFEHIRARFQAHAPGRVPVERRE
ncbi:unnamed protein product [Phytophthora fragariaefolia]|uniref:Unnamed protein product n=1 Tax=Phytophthora fragariaefolia TaxID=1490495 RepID=A0A9W6XZU0_9STRA|nr:unnamed protein product [Phytophthora fragariaefolia]